MSGLCPSCGARFDEHDLTKLPLIQHPRPIRSIVVPFDTFLEWYINIVSIDHDFAKQLGMRFDRIVGLREGFEKFYEINYGSQISDDVSGVGVEKSQ